MKVNGCEDAESNAKRQDERAVRNQRSTLCLLMLCAAAGGCRPSLDDDLRSLTAEETLRLYNRASQDADLALVRKVMSDRLAWIVRFDDRVTLQERLIRARMLLEIQYGEDVASELPAISRLVDLPATVPDHLMEWTQATPTLYTCGQEGLALRRISGRWQLDMHGAPPGMALFGRMLSKDDLGDHPAHVDALLALLRSRKAGDEKDVRKRLLALRSGDDPRVLMTDEQYERRVVLERHIQWWRSLPWTEFMQAVRGRVCFDNAMASESPGVAVRGHPGALITFELQDARSEEQRLVFVRDHRFEEHLLLGEQEIAVPEAQRSLRFGTPYASGKVELTKEMLPTTGPMEIRYRVRAIPVDASHGPPVEWVTKALVVHVREAK